MARDTIEGKVAALEADVDRLKVAVDMASAAQTSGTKTRWHDEVAGTFEDDAIFDEAMRLGREYRESLRPKPRSKRKV